MLGRVARLLPLGVGLCALALTFAGSCEAQAASPGEKKTRKADDKPAKPSEERREIGTYHALRKDETSILVQRPRDKDTWTRVAAEGGVFTSDHLVSLPGFASEVRAKSGVHLLLWGTLPEVNQSSPVVAYLFESAVTLHDNAKVDLDFTLERGRVYLSNHKDKPALVRVRFGKAVWDVELKTGDTEVVLELVIRYTEDIDYLAGEEPLANLSLFVASGKAGVKPDNAPELPELESPPGRAFVVWDNKGGEAKGPFKIEKDGDLIRFMGKEPPNADSVKAAKEYRPAFEALSKLIADKKPVDKGLLEGVKAGKPNEKALCIYSLGAIDAVSELLDILASDDEKAGPEREIAVMALRRWTSHGPHGTKLLYDSKAKEGLLVKKGYKAVEAETLLQMLYLQISEATARRKEIYETLAGFLRHSKMPIRELAYYHLKQLTFGIKGLPAYDPTWPTERRNKAAAEWEALITKGELPPPPPKPK